jgi:hypothetical protein
MKRLSWKRAGYDCKYAPCQHTPKDEHGIDGGSYTWAVVTDEGDLGADLSLFAQEWPETIPVEERRKLRRSGIERFREGRLTGSLGIHMAFATDRESLRGGARGRQDCKLVSPCWASTSYLGVDAFAKVLQTGPDGFPTFEQGEPFWAALEAWLQERAPGLRAERADLRWYLCPVCHGEGFLERQATVEVKGRPPETPGSPPSEGSKTTK